MRQALLQLTSTKKKHWYIVKGHHIDKTSSIDKTSLSMQLASWQGCSKERLVKCVSHKQDSQSQLYNW